MVFSFVLLVKQVLKLFVNTSFHKVSICRLHPIHAKAMNGFYGTFYKRYINCEIGLKVVMNEFENGKKARIKEKRN